MKTGSINPSRPARVSRRMLFASIILAFAYLLFVEVYLAHVRSRRSVNQPVTITYKPASELSRIVPAKDGYPCLVIEPSPAGKRRHTSLSAEIRQCLPSLNNDADIEQYEVDLRSGRFVMRKTDFFLADNMPLALTRAYGQWDSTSRAFGVGSNHNYDIFPYGTRNPYTYMNVLLADGSYIHYNRISEGSSYADAVFEHTAIPSTVFDKSRISWNAEHWDFRFQDGRLYRFPEAYFAKRGVEGALVGMKDSVGNEILLLRDPARNLTSVTSPHGHWIRLTYDTSNRIATATDDVGRSARYSYDEAGRLAEVKASGGETLWRYGYEGKDMARVEDFREKIILTNHFKGGRMDSLTVSPGTIYHFDYLFNRHGDVVETSVRDPSGKISVFRF